jgi:chaperonin GroEL
LKIGKEGVITVEEAKGTETYVDVVEEYSLTEDIFFVTNSERMEMELEDPYILLYDNLFFKELLPVLEPVAQSGNHC